MMDADDREALRREIGAMLDTITDRGSLLFARWLLLRVLNDEPVPPDADMRKLRGAFVRIVEALRDGSKEVDPADWALVAKYASAGETRNGRPLGLAVKFYRTRKKLTRLELSKRCRMSVRAILALERGQVEDISIPRFADLALGLGIRPTELLGKVMEYLREGTS